MADLVRPRPTFRVVNPEVTFNVLTVHLRLTVETNPLHALVAFIFFIILGFLQIKFPEKPTPFELHPNTMLLSIASFLVYCLAFCIRLRFASQVLHPLFVDTLMEVFGSLSLISLLLMLLPPDALGSFRFTVYTLWFVSHVLEAIIRIRTTCSIQQMRRRVRRPLLPNTSMDLDYLVT
ncbi:putative transmembrane protein [Sesbania bispinosa]|nr:putative transmembrane protein [Sesbania bispinosa]